MYIVVNYFLKYNFINSVQRFTTQSFFKTNYLQNNPCNLHFVRNNYQNKAYQLKESSRLKLKKKRVSAQIYKAPSDNHLAAAHASQR